MGPDPNTGHRCLTGTETCHKAGGGYLRKQARLELIAKIFGGSTSEYCMDPDISIAREIPEMGKLEWMQYRWEKAGKRQDFLQRQIK